MSLLNPWLILIAATAFLAFGGFSYMRGRSDCADAYQTKTAIETLKDKETIDEIRNNRTDGAGVVKRLRDKSF